MSNITDPSSIQAVQRESPYGYTPSKTVAMTFLFLFILSSIIHLGQALKFRAWWILPTIVFCGGIEILGWSARYWSSISPLAGIPFQIQITATIIAPTPLLAANFVIFGEIIKRLGARYSRLTPKLYSVIFCTCDVVSLFVQGAGGGIAAAANTREGANKGANIMLFGIVFQLLVIIVFAACALEFLYRWNIGSPVRDASPDDGANGSVPVAGVLTSRLKIMTASVGFVTLLLFIRAIYRTIELAGGWGGRILTTEIYFNVLDATMVVLAIYTYNFAHPGLLLAEPVEGKVWHMLKGYNSA